MAFTMHSHSGQFCPGHAKDDLEVIVQHALSLGFSTMALTEHMPRFAQADLYPEELDHPLGAAGAIAELPPRHEAFLVEAKRLRSKYAGKGLDLLIGFEGEWIRAADYEPWIRNMAAHPDVDFFVGSLHHANGIPIDFDKAYYDRAIESLAVGAEEPGVDGDKEERGERRLYGQYYDEQYEMLRALQPRVVGHFDLIRLLSRDPGRNVRDQWPDVWARMVRNLELIASYGGWLECNSSALRKKLAEPYPCREVATTWLSLGGKFTLSDDSHGIAQVGTNYARALDYLSDLGVTSLWTFERRKEENGKDSRLRDKEVAIDTVKAVVQKWT